MLYFYLNDKDYFLFFFDNFLAFSKIKYQFVQCKSSMRMLGKLLERKFNNF